MFHLNGLEIKQFALPYPTKRVEYVSWYYVRYY